MYGELALKTQTKKPKAQDVWLPGQRYWPVPHCEPQASRVSALGPIELDTPG